MTINYLQEQAYAYIYEHLEAIGFTRSFVRRVVLPEWWDDIHEHNPHLLPVVLTSVARFLGQPLAEVSEGYSPLKACGYEQAKMFREQTFDESEGVAPAIHTAVQIATVVIRYAGLARTDTIRLPQSSLQWHEYLRTNGASITLGAMLSDLWKRGIPVVQVDALPGTKMALDGMPIPVFQSLACIIQDRPVILLCSQIDEPAHAASLIAYEMGNIIAGHCTFQQVDTPQPPSERERKRRWAEKFAIETLLGKSAEAILNQFTLKILAENQKDFSPSKKRTPFHLLVAHAAQMFERERGIAADHLIYAWAASSYQYDRASMAAQALQKATGARRLLLQNFVDNINIFDASETDRSLFRCVYGTNVIALGFSTI